MSLQEHKVFCMANEDLGIAYDDDLKTIRCPRCDEELIERFAEDHICASEMKKCQICKTILRGD